MEALITRAKAGFSQHLLHTGIKNKALVGTRLHELRLKNLGFGHCS